MFDFQFLKDIDLQEKERALEREEQGAEEVVGSEQNSKEIFMGYSADDEDDQENYSLRDFLMSLPIRGEALRCVF